MKAFKSEAFASENLTFPDTYAAHSKYIPVRKVRAKAAKKGVLTTDPLTKQHTTTPQCPKEKKKKKPQAWSKCAVSVVTKTYHGVRSVCLVDRHRDARYEPPFPG